MPGMIWNAHSLLTKALDSGTNGISAGLFSKDLRGVMMLTNFQAGFIWAGNVGSGILLKKKEGVNEWSAPCAMGLAGPSFGFLAGASYKDVMVFIYDSDTMTALAGEVGARGGGLIELTVGSFGRNASVDANLSNRGAGSTVSVAFTKGLFGCLGVDFGAAMPRNSVNTQFYEKDISATQILNGGEGVAIPEGSDTLIDLVYEKLGMLTEGKTYEPGVEEQERVQLALVKANSEDNEQK